MKTHNPHIILKILLRIIQSMQQNPEPFVKNPGKDFSRNRALPFQDVVLFILTLASHKLKKELYRYFAPLKKQVPYSSALCQQRAKLNEAAFPHIFSSFNAALPFLKKIKGYHALAMDGTDTNVPADTRDCATFIPYNSKNGGYHQLHINACFDLCEDRFVDIEIQPRGEFDETGAACVMVDRNPLKGKCLYICDRGYQSFNLMAHISENGHCFLIRAKEISSDNSPFHFLTFPENDEFDEDITFFLTRSRAKKYTENPSTYKVIYSQTRFDYIESEDKDKIYKLSFRLLRIKLDDGLYEYLLTNLPRIKFSLADMKDLYHLRWGIETSFLFLKYGVCLNYFHSIKTERLIQEIYAKIILYNFISLMLSCIEIPDKDTKYKYIPSFTDATYLCRDYLLGFQTWDYIHSELQRHLTPIRPDRKYPRRMASQRLKSLQHRS